MFKSMNVLYAFFGHLYRARSVTALEGRQEFYVTHLSMFIKHIIHSISNYQSSSEAQNVLVFCILEVRHSQ
jgi:hypothetical protein